MDAIKTIINAFIAAINSLLVILGMEDKKIEVDEEVSGTIEGWFDTVVNG